MVKKFGHRWVKVGLLISVCVCLLSSCSPRPNVKAVVKGIGNFPATIVQADSADVTQAKVKMVATIDEARVECIPLPRTGIGLARVLNQTDEYDVAITALLTCSDRRTMEEIDAGSYQLSHKILFDLTSASGVVLRSHSEPFECPSGGIDNHVQVSVRLRGIPRDEMSHVSSVVVHWE